MCIYLIILNKVCNSISIFDVIFYCKMKSISYISALFLFYILTLFACKKDTPKDPDVSGTYAIGSAYSWKLASTPLRFPEAVLSNDISNGLNRAKLSWYTIDASVFYDKSSPKRPYNITKTDISKDDCRVIWENEIFPDNEPATGPPRYLPSLSIDFYPFERGQWNYDTDPTHYSAGISTSGELNSPGSRWGGIMRKLERTDFPINYLEFWLLDPFTTSPGAEGILIFDIGEISEDVLNDGLLSAEHTIPGTAIETAWGQVLPLSDIPNFDVMNPEEQDIGLDELKTEAEITYFNAYLKKIESTCTPDFYHYILSDPSGDNYHPFLGDDYDASNFKVRERYKYYCGDEHNSLNTEDAFLIYSHYPNSEDINQDNTLNTINRYFEYRVEISMEAFKPGQNYIVEYYQDMMGSHLREDGTPAKSKFYHFRIPLKDYSAQYGMPYLSDTPDFIRIYLTGFLNPVNLRIFNLSLSEEIIQ
jgi:cell surface protein SprA